MIPILDNSERARRAVLFFYLLLPVTIAERVFFFFVDNVYTLDNINILGYVFYPYSLIYSILSFTSSALFICTVVVFLQWFKRAYHNLEQAGFHNEYSSKWVVWIWFIPIANLALPYQMTKEIWYKTQKEYTKDIEEHGLVRGWWALFVVSFCILKLFASQKELNFTEYPGWAFFSAITRIAAIIVTIFFIKKVASFEELFRVHVTADTVGQEIAIAVEKDIEEEYY